MKQTTVTKWHDLHQQVYSILILLIFTTSCHGPNKSYLVKDNFKEDRIESNTNSTSQTINFYPWDEADLMFFKPQQISQYIRRIFQDKNGNLWFGTNDDGVCRYNGKTLDYFTTKEGLSGNAVRGILEDNDGNLWFGTDGGVTKYDGKTFTNFAEKEGLINHEVWSIAKDKIGNIWVGTLGGVFLYNPLTALHTEGKLFIPFPIPTTKVEDPKSRFNTNLVWCILEDTKGNLWFGTDGSGIYKYDGKSFTNFTELEGLCNNNVGCIYEDKKGNIWCGTQFGGVSRYDGKSFTNFSKKEGLSSDFIYTIFQDSKGTLWLSALGGGVCRFDGKLFTNYSANDGLTNTYVQSIFEDKTGKLWFGSGAGLFRFTGKSFINVTRRAIGQGC